MSTPGAVPKDSIPHPSLIDAHCHLDLLPNPAELIRKLESKRVYCIAVTNTPSVFPVMEKLAAGCHYVRPALGLHPELAAERIGKLGLFSEYLPRTNHVGEVGLDYVTADERERRLQRQVFGTVLSECDRVGDKILTVHSRRAAEDVVEAIGERFQGIVILHWYTGIARTLQKALSRGVYISVNSAMAKSKKSRRILELTPRHRVLTETDAPFAATAGSPDLPRDTSLVLSSLAALWGSSEQEVQHQIYQNWEEVLALRSGLTNTHRRGLAK